MNQYIATILNKKDSFIRKIYKSYMINKIDIKDLLSIKQEYCEFLNLSESVNSQSFKLLCEKIPDLLIKELVNNDNAFSLLIKKSSADNLKTILDKCDEVTLKAMFNKKEDTIKALLEYKEIQDIISIVKLVFNKTNSPIPTSLLTEDQENNMFNILSVIINPGDALRCFDWKERVIANSIGESLKNAEVFKNINMELIEFLAINRHARLDHFLNAFSVMKETEIEQNIEKVSKTLDLLKVEKSFYSLSSYYSKRTDAKPIQNVLFNAIYEKTKQAKEYQNNPEKLKKEYNKQGVKLLSEKLYYLYTDDDNNKYREPSCQELREVFDKFKTINTGLFIEENISTFIEEIINLSHKSNIYMKEGTHLPFDPLVLGLLFDDDIFLSKGEEYHRKKALSLNNDQLLTLSNIIPFDKLKKYTTTVIEYENEFLRYTYHNTFCPPLVMNENKKIEPLTTIDQGRFEAFFQYIKESRMFKQKPEFFDAIDIQLLMSDKKTEKYKEEVLSLNSSWESLYKGQLHKGEIDNITNQIIKITIENNVAMLNEAIIPVENEVVTPVKRKRL